ncbi:MAG: hypothetical protein Q9M40_01450 [Sulfurimonas sp.]|nr:hypothetical protein [Sulfurimonas sp.]
MVKFFMMEKFYTKEQNHDSLDLGSEEKYMSEGSDDEFEIVEINGIKSQYYPVLSQALKSFSKQRVRGCHFTACLVGKSTKNTSKHSHSSSDKPMLCVGSQMP